MGWTKVLALPLLALACTDGPYCLADFFFQASVPSGSTGCVVTFSRGDASFVVGVGELDGACGPTFERVECSGAFADALVCERGCALTSGEETMNVHAADAGSASSIHDFFGHPPLDVVVDAGVTCSGGVVASSTAALESCAY